MSNSPNAKKSRVLFSDEQKEALKLAFTLDPYPNMTSIEFLCQELNLTHRSITNWFHNHRMRLKQAAAGGDGVPYPSGASRDGQQLDPLQFRLLLNRRLQQLQAEKAGAALPGPLPFPGLPTPLPFPYNMDARLSEPMSGLDLSMKSDNDLDQQSDEASNLSEDGGSPPSAGSPRDDDEEETSEQGRKAAAPSVRSSRRKPAAPQWVNPQWAAESQSRRPPPQLINGVCVLQTGLESGDSAPTVAVGEGTAGADAAESGAVAAAAMASPAAESAEPASVTAPGPTGEEDGHGAEVAPPPHTEAEEDCSEAE